ncbi:DUF1735 and LamG domain-containing protein [Capnocytophaga genosp. AHN8471]|uniref:DUF1735 and LamG domain-containing protein n=1 Tax=Capnocytophaga genosp. AHN8471 TaxID=327574 RepID=A0ABS1YSZ8_9FLAO|nr:DUF1735 and LamG domain-containing protein [Capnocytophaga genosp. AHN8471]MBM0649519.1 DUF1735 and LamG domain-containing protein [Capnocytophaga genosp. AHN8471]MBM0661135.1 DUF1735 and LamG domain-containing protein [Capnocytophaga genosp. AHN8471]
MKRNLIIGMFLALAACAPKEDVGGGAKAGGQSAVLLQKDGNKTAEFSSPVALSAQANEVGTQKSVAYQVQLFKENNSNLAAYVTLDDSQVAKYNSLYGTKYTVLPAKYISYTKTLNIKAGNILSDEGTAKVTVSDELKDNTAYMFALRLSSVSGASVTPNTQLLMVSFEKVKGQIKNTLAVTRDEFLVVNNGYSNVSDIGYTFTMEGLINVQKFRSNPDDPGEAGISTFMGTEGKTLLRFGDSGVDPDHLQANGQDIGLKFKTNQWYHIALVVDGSKTIAYVNGKKITEFNSPGSLRTFYIGKSWSEGRGIVARFSELRLWNVARTAEQIKDGMYEVNPTENGLYAYWKMNEVKDNKIPDASGNDRDLILYGQASKNGRQTIQLHEEEKGVKITE